MAFVKLRDIKIEGNLWLGSTIKITAVFNEAPDSVNITIEDSAGIDKVDRISMTQVSEANKVWEYTYQSNENDNDGDYEFYIRATKGSNTSLETGKFTLFDADDD